jgi:hypothetical protein
MRIKVSCQTRDNVILPFVQKHPNPIQEDETFTSVTNAVFKVSPNPSMIDEFKSKWERHFINKAATGGRLINNMTTNFRITHLVVRKVVDYERELER